MGKCRSVENLPGEIVSLSYGKIGCAYTQRKGADGTGASETAAGWELDRTKK